MIELFQGDSFELIKNIKDSSIKLVQTDVPYPDMEIHDKEKHIVTSDKWIEWFSPLAHEIYRVLEDGGSFVTTINCKNNFVFYHEWVTWMVEELGFTYVYDWYWMKQNIIPGKMSRPRDAIDHIAHFYKGSIADSKKCYNMKTIDDWTKYNDVTKIPTNVINARNIDDSHYYEACKRLNIKHPGKYPSLIPDLFIRLLTDENDTILEPFNGSGTTTLKAEELGRNSIGFEFNDNFIKLACEQYEMFGYDYMLN